MEKAFLHAAMKLSKHARILSIQAVNNCLMSGVVLENTINRFLENALTEHQKVKMELSYLFTAMVQYLSEELLQNYIMKLNLIQILQVYLQESCNMKNGE